MSDKVMQKPSLSYTERKVTPAILAEMKAL